MPQQWSVCAGGKSPLPANLEELIDFAGGVSRQRDEARFVKTWMLGLPVSADASRNPSPSAVPAHHVGVLSCTRARPPGACSRDRGANLTCVLVCEQRPAGGPLERP